MSDPSLQRLLRLTAQAPKRLAMACVFSVASGFATIVPFFIAYRILAALVSGNLAADPGSVLHPLVWLAVGAICCRHLFFYVSLIFSHLAAFDILLHLRKDVVAHLGRLPMGFFDQKRTGGIKKTVTEDVEQVELFIAHHLPDLVSAIVIPLVLLTCLFLVHPFIGLAAFVPLPLSLWLQIRIRKQILHEDMIAGYHKALMRMNHTIVEFVRGMEAIKIFNRSKDAFTRLREDVGDFRDHVHRVTEVSAPAWALFVVSVNAAVFCILPVGLFLHDTARITTAEFLFCLLVGAGYMAPVMKIALMASLLERIREGMRQLDDILSAPVLPEPEQGKEPVACGVRFADVSFSYGSRLALDHVTFTLPPGSITALVGPSGAGKTTIAQLASRMRDPDAGSIQIGGVDLREMTWETLTRKVSCVFQETVMFSGTLMENIRMGRSEACDAEVMAAAKSARCDTFIHSLPDGFATRVGAGGIHLSGGERQRINLARVILRDAPVVVLDEATAFADPENELAIQEALSEVMAEKTVIVIAHRLATITECDQILVMEAGRLCEAGTHGELVRNGGRYAAMWNAHTRSADWVMGEEVQYA